MTNETKPEEGDTSSQSTSDALNERARRIREEAAKALNRLGVDYVEILRQRQEALRGCDRLYEILSKEDL